MGYKKINNILGWVVFAIATIVYLATLEETTSLWDCGEYITAAYKLEVGHPPGAPLFMVLGRLFSFFADPENVAVWINRLSALSSSLTILFMFWSITALVKKMVLKTKSELSKGDTIAILGSGLIGGLAYTFSDTLWFSAVEGEVYAMASLFTAAIFWAILKWDEEMAEVQAGKLSVEYAPNRWLILILFLVGLAIGVHLLGILLVPAIGYVIYFRLWQTIKPTQFFLTGILSIVILGFIQEGIIPGSISLASSFEVAFTNSLGLPFFSGTIFFFLALIAVCFFVVRYARKKQHTILYNAMMGLIVLLIGYGSFAVIVIRSNANTPLDENDPENLVTLHSYLKREQYGSAPILFGPHYNSIDNPRTEWDERSPFYLRRFVVTKGENILKAFKSEEAAKAYAKDNGAEYEEKYFESNASYRKNAVPTFAQTTFFPRMYNNDDPRKVQGYKDWSGYDPTTPGEKGKDGLRLPTFGENFRYFTSYQVNWMYWRYFMWNFAGRQNDYQGHGDALRGNWISGIGAVDNARLGNQDEAPYYTTHNPANNKFFFLPLILGLIGLFFHFYKAPKDAFVVMLAFLFTGLAIVVYLNQKTFEPRERDYAYAGSFYFFAIWIGVSVYALYYAFQNFTKAHFKKMGIVIGAGLLVMLISDTSSDVSMPNTIAWLYMSAITAGLFGLMVGLRKVLKSESQGAVFAVVLTLFVPILMGMQGWDDHDRSLKTTAHDLAKNYLSSCGENGILFTNGDNDTFPLWYMQEVEGYKTDVRVCNLSLMQTDWYTDQMKMKAYESEPLPIKFREDQILMYAGSTDQVLFNLSDGPVKIGDLFMVGSMNPEVIKKVIQMRYDASPAAAVQAVNNFVVNVSPSVGAITTSQASIQNRLNSLKNSLTVMPTEDKLVEDVYAKIQAMVEIFSGYQNGYVTMSEPVAKALQQGLTTIEAGWEWIILADAMEFVRDDSNMLSNNGGYLRFFPTNKFIMPVNAQNALKAGVISKDDVNKCKKEIRFQFSDRGITREDVMMLDILANNDWKRGIYFSSPAGSQVSIALLRAGAIKQNGMAFELSPTRSSAQFAADEMYENLMKNYSFGATNNPDVLTDYYARRHTSQYRLHFASLAEYYVNQILKADNVKAQGPGYIEYLNGVGRTDEAEEMSYLLENNDEVKATAKKRAIALLKRSLELMPASIVLDNGEPTASRDKISAGGQDYPVYDDGHLTDYVEMLFIAGDKKTANELGMELAKQYESVINFFMESNLHTVLSSKNHPDLFSNLNAYFKLTIAANDPEHDPNGELAKHTKSVIGNLYSKVLPELYTSIENYAREEGESIRRGQSGAISFKYYQLRDYLEALGTNYGVLQNNEAPAAPAIP